MVGDLPEIIGDGPDILRIKISQILRIPYAFSMAPVIMDDGAVALFCQKGHKGLITFLMLLHTVGDLQDPLRPSLRQDQKQGQGKPVEIGMKGQFFSFHCYLPIFLQGFRPFPPDTERSRVEAPGRRKAPPYFRRSGPERKREPRGDLPGRRKPPG